MVRAKGQEKRSILENFRVRQTANSRKGAGAPSILGSCLSWAGGAYRLEAFLSYRSLKHSNLNLKPRISHHTERLKDLDRG